MNNKYNKYKDLVIISLILSLFLIGIAYIGIFNNINLKLTDNLYGGKAPLEEIIILKIDDRSISDIGRWPWERNIYSQIIEKLNNSKVIGIDIGFFEESNNQLHDKKLEETLINSDNVIIAVEYLNFEVDENKQIIGNKLLKPIFNISNEKLGYINVIKDSDGIVRSTNLNVIGDYNSFTENIYLKFQNETFNLESSSNKFIINYIGEPNSIKSYSLSDVLNNKVNITNFDNKIILIGATSADLHDDFLVPTSKGINMPGIEIHANILQTMLLNNELKYQNIFSLFICILVSSLIIGFISSRFNFLVSILVMIGLILFWVFLSIFIFEFNIILNLVYVPLTLFLTFTSVTGYNYITEEKKKKEIHSAFGKYVSPKIIEEIMQNPNKLKLGGEKKEVTIFFSDIASFTNLSEKLTPEELVNFLNLYLTKMTNLVTKNEGIVDKYIGDAIMAFWGAPIEQKNQVELGCITSLEMFRCRDKIAKELKIKDYKFDFRIGLNYGEAIVGNMGSDERFDYTLIGDSINLASRLESVNKQYGTNIMVSESVYNKTKSKFVYREIDLIKVKGKNFPVRIFELIDYRENIPKYKDKLEVFAEGLKLYRNKDFDKAIIIFNVIVKKYNDTCSKVFIKRCKELKNEKLPKNWDGVYTMKSK